MRIPNSFWQSLPVAVAAGLVICLTPACKPGGPHPGPARQSAARNNAASSVTNKLAAEYVSLFEQLMPPKGRDPFFPNSHRRDPVPVMSAPTEKAPAAAELVLKGIVVAASHRMAVINTSILEVGESGTVRVPGGRVRVKCMEIGEDSAVIQVSGETQPKRLQLSKKSN